MRNDPPSSANLAYVEQIWEQYKKDPDSVGYDWRVYFEAFESSDAFIEGTSPKVAIGHKQLLQGYGPGGKVCAGCGRAAAMSLLQFNVSHLIRNYRVRGHLTAKINPLGGNERVLPELDPSYYGMSEEDLDLIFNAGHMSPHRPLKLREIISNLKETYCGAIGAQFMHIDSLKAREWLQDRMEGTRNRISLSKAQQKRILERLTDAVVFEQFLQKKFVGAKSFSLEGAETLIPLLDQAIEKAGEQGIDNIVIGMPHRGRLNVLANILGKHPSAIFGEFRDRDAEKLIGRGDVKYHLGFQRTWVTETKKRIHVDLAFNPSHLEFVGPVAQGALKARQIRHNDFTGENGLLILIHGDASIAGEGIVQETLNLSELDEFSVGGTLHIVVNNQIGFTTLSSDGRSTTYASDVAKMLQGPIFHVNGEKPDAVAQCLDVCLDFRKQFKRDTVIDMYCYRRRGHNEGDEPTFTQPLMYQQIRRRPDVMTSYLEHLLELKGLTREEAREIHDTRVRHLEEEYQKTVEKTAETGDAGNIFLSSGKPFQGGMDSESPEVPTAVAKTELRRLMTRLTTLPEGFAPHRKMDKQLQARMAAVNGERPVDWGCAETLALASLLDEGIPVRLSGQDSQRGTFSHRHAVLHDAENGAVYKPLANINDAQGRVDIVNSPLTEGGVLGFEYGYSTAHPKTLVIWEAQFGDFANVAQVYIDQFIASGEAKWGILSGIVLLLPHGLEGTGPEHASARLERYLALAALDNYLVVCPTTPAQLFHLLRRQAKRRIRKPLVVMSPKSMLRHPMAVSSIEELATGEFKKIIVDTTVDTSRVDHILLCTGKIYYDLVAKREEVKDDKTAVVRIEQLYPLLPETLISALSVYPKGVLLTWVQEEPLNMGSNSFVRLKFEPALREHWAFKTVGRPEAATPATGSAASHKLEQTMIIESAFKKG
jgi:2-oxoglutarate dehydrogenase E1 component